MTLRELKNEFNQSLEKRYSPSEIKIIFEDILNLTLGLEPWQINGGMDFENAHLDKQIHFIRSLLAEAELGKPLQYLTQRAFFFNETFKVDENVLIPRPETEELVEWVLQEIKEKDSLAILDVGTGSGIIPIILAKHAPQHTYLALDICEKALDIAKENARRLKVEVKFEKLDFLNEVNTLAQMRFDVIVSNPPYIPVSEKISMQKSVINFEPETALFVPDHQPLIFYEKLKSFGETHLKKGGSIFMELHQEYATDTEKIFKENFQTALKKDISGNYRMLKAVK